MARRLKTISSTGATTGGGYTHPACICQTIICSPCYVTNFTSPQDSTECSMPSEGAQWVTLISQCGADVSTYSGTCIDFIYDFYNYQEVSVDIILHTTATSGTSGVYVGSDTYLHCCCYPYQFVPQCVSFGSVCCHAQLACTNCTCKYIHFNAVFRPSVRCSDQHVIASGCTSPSIGGNKFNFGALGSYVQLASHGSTEFHICSFNGAAYCQFWCNFKRIRFLAPGPMCNSPHGIDKVHIAGKPYKNYTPAS